MPIAPNDSWSWIWNLGYRSIIPIRPNSKKPGIKVAGEWVDLPKWQILYPSESDVDKYREMETGIGIRCEAGLLAIDADTLVEELANTIRTRVEARLGPLPLRIGQAPKALFFCKTEPGYKHPKIVFDGGVVEVRTNGQFVAAGIHPETLEAYAWSRQLPHIDELPVVSAEVLDALWVELRDALPNGKFSGASTNFSEPPNPESLRGTVKRVRDALKWIPNDYADRSTYINVLTAAKASAPNDLEGAWEAVWPWCESWSGVNEEEVVRRDFDSLKPRDLGIGFLEALANRRSGNRASTERFDERVRPDGIDPTPYRFPEPSAISVRASLYGGHYIRKFFSATIAQSKVGKSTLVLAEALAMASGKPLLGVQPAGQFRVWWWNGEDPYEELERRVAAAMKFYGLTREDVGDRLLVDSGREMPIVLAEQKGSNANVNKGVVDSLCDAILRKRIDVTIADPFISLHKVSENDNNAIDMVAKTGALIAERTNSALEAVHHSRKLNGMGAVVEDGRGASALLGATRSMRALSKMTEDEGRKAGVGTAWRSLFRFSDVSSNMAPPTDDGAHWLQIIGVNLENGAGDDMDRVVNGDRVGVARLFDLPAAQAASVAAEEAHAPPNAESAAFEAIAANEWRKDTRASNWVGVPIARAFGFDTESDDGRAATKNVIRNWLLSRKIEEYESKDRFRDTRTFIRIVTKIGENDLFG